MSPSSRYLVPYAATGEQDSGGLPGMLARWFGGVLERSRQRADLAIVSDRDLHDAGLYRSDLEFALSARARRL